MNQEDFAHAFLANLLARLASLETPPDAAGSILAMYGGSAVFAKNADRRVAGHLNSALADLDFLLDIPEQKLADGNRINTARVEHTLNRTPRRCSSNRTIWPPMEFWRCLRRLRPDLPPRTVLPTTSFLAGRLTYREDLLRNHLPPRLVDKFITSLADFDVLYPADELGALIQACTPDAPLSRELPAFAAEMHRLASFRLEQLLQDNPA